MTDTENTPVCRAQYSLNGSGPWDCVLSENHVGPHRDEDHDTWDITYRDVPQCPVSIRTPDGTSQCSQRQWHEGGHTIQLLTPETVPVDIRVRPLQDQVTDLVARVGLLEAAWTVGGETLSERLDRVVLGTMGQIRTVARRVDNLEQTSASGAATDDMFVAVNRRLARLEADAHPEECHGEQCTKDDAVTLSTDEYTALLKDREELHALRNTAQSDVVTEKAVERGDMLSVSRTAWEQRGKDSDKLSALEQAGVDNWEGYSHAMSTYRGDEED